MIGNLADAALAVSLADENSSLSILSRIGCTRIVYLINGVVYKVNRERGSQWDDNMFEWNNYNRIVNLTLPTGVRVPAMSMYTVGLETVIAAEFVKGEPTGECLSEGACDCGGYCINAPMVYDIIEATGVTDICYGNVISNEDGLWLIDIAC